MSNTQERLEALEQKGWRLVSHKPATEDEQAFYELERLVSSKSHTECGNSLAQAISDAEAFDARLEAYPQFVRSSHGVAVGSGLQASSSAAAADVPAYVQPEDVAADGWPYLDLRAAREGNSSSPAEQVQGSNLTPGRGKLSLDAE